MFSLKLHRNFALLYSKQIPMLVVEYFHRRIDRVLARDEYFPLDYQLFDTAEKRKKIFSSQEKE